jgi:hypothetical protein
MGASSTVSTFPGEASSGRGVGTSAAGVLDSNAGNRRSLPTSRGEAPWHSSVKVPRTAHLAADEAKCVEVAGKKIALFNLEGSVYVIDDTRTHRGGPLSEGEVSGEKVT